MKQCAQEKRLSGKIISWRESEQRKKLIELADKIKFNDIVITILPFDRYYRPSLPVHILQATAKKYAQQDISIFYSNIIFAEWIGEDVYINLCELLQFNFISERIFCHCAFDKPILGENAEKAMAPLWELSWMKAKQKFSFDELRFIAEEIKYFIDDIALFIKNQNVKIVGSSNNFYQTSACVSLMKAVKKYDDSIITIVGGASCADELSTGIASLNAPLDYIFSNESEKTFCDFLINFRKNKLPEEKIIKGELFQDLNDLPALNFDDYFLQLKYFIRDKYKTPEELWLPFESSRGCWWCVKKPCTFCGLNGSIRKYRMKKPDKVLKELDKYLTEYPAKNVFIHDNIMPSAYYKKLLPHMFGRYSSVIFFSEQKAILSLYETFALKNAGIELILPGLESFSTKLLKRMNKGASAAQILNTLRHARSTYLSVNYFIIYGFPNDTKEEYQDILNLIQYIHHLCPPLLFRPLIFDRFSAYHLYPDEFNIKNLRPHKGYYDIFPEHTDYMNIAYKFEGEYESAFFKYNDLMQEIFNGVTEWKKKWSGDGSKHAGLTTKFSRALVGKDEEKFKDLPALEIRQDNSGKYFIVDSRGINGFDKTEEISYKQALVSLVPISPERNAEFSEEIDWAVRNKILIKLDDDLIPLATANYELFNKFENENIMINSN
jgi:ribosomal peptide maturation radical SAM protein 1